MIIWEKNLGEIEYKDCDCFFEDESVKGKLITYKCLCCYKRLFKKLHEKLKKQCKSTINFSNNDINKFISLLRKGAYPNDYMDDWQGICHAIYRHAKAHKCMKDYDENEELSYLKYWDVNNLYGWAMKVDEMKACSK